jgi:hypothetical protein
MCIYKGNVDSWLIQLQGEKTNISVRANRIAKMLYAGFNAFSFGGKIKLKKNRRFVYKKFMYVLHRQTINDAYNLVKRVTIIVVLLKRNFY